METNRDQLRYRTKQLALRVMKLADALPPKNSAQAIARQIVRSGTSVAGNYRAACRGRSRAEFAAKLCIVVEELDETVLWLELLAEGGIVRPRRLADLTREANELLAIFSAAKSTARRKPPNH
jgi:four helix bundle protein